MSLKINTILLLTSTMLCSWELLAMNAEKDDGKSKNVPLTTTTHATTTTTTITTTNTTTTTTTPIATTMAPIAQPAVIRPNMEVVKLIKDPYQRHLATLKALKPIIRQAVIGNDTNPDDEMTRIRCLWNLGTLAYRATALEILEKKALANNSPLNIRINFLKKLGEFLQNNSLAMLDLKLFEDFSPQGMQASGTSPLFLFYKKALDEISHSSMAKGERDFQTLKLQTFYNRLSQKLTDSTELGRDINKLFRTLQASVDLSKSLLHKIDYFQNFYLKAQPHMDVLASLGEEISKASTDASPEEAKTLRRLASKISFKLASLLPADLPDYKRQSREYSYYNQSAQLGHSLAKYHLGELCNTELQGTQRSEWYDPDRAYGYFLRSAQENNPLAAYRLANILDKGDERFGLDPDKANAQMWRQKAAKQGHPYAQYEVAQDDLKADSIESSTRDIQKLSSSKLEEKKQEGLKLLFLSAEAGYGRAQLALAEKYEKGDGVEKNPTFAFFWYGKAAQQGEISSYYPLGLAYEKGIGVEQDYENAHAFYSLAIKNGNAQADIRLGKIYLKGIAGKLPSDVFALECFQRASEQNNSDGLYYKGLMQLTGKGFPQPHHQDAVISFEKAAKQKHKKALFQLGVMNQFWAETPGGYEVARKFYESAEQEGSLEAPYFLGWLYDHGIGVKQDKEKALALWEKAAGSGHAEAAFKAGKRYVNAYIEEGDDSKAKKAYQLLKQAGNTNHVDALYLIGVLSEEGIGCVKSPIDAMDNYRKSAAAGQASAQYKLGVFFEAIVEAGHYEEALKWYKLAAEQNHIEARFALARIYREGVIVPKDFKKAFEYTKELGDEKSSMVLAEMKALVKAAQIDGEKPENSGFSENDAKPAYEALIWLEELAAKGNPVAQNYIARAAEIGTLVPLDIKKAITLYQRAAKKGQRSAQRRLHDLKRAHILAALNIKE